MKDKHLFSPDCHCMKCLMKFDSMVTQFFKSAKKPKKKGKP